MSTEARCLQFLTDAQRPKDNKTVKDIEKLKKFLFKNQEHRFTEREQTHLFQAIQVYANSPHDTNDGDHPALSLVDDALKMPFTVFTTSHKKSMLRWHAKLTGGPEPGAATSGPVSAKYQVIDIADGIVTCMDPDGETLDIALTDVSQEMQEAITQGFEDGKDVQLKITVDTKQVISHTVT